MMTEKQIDALKKWLYNQTYSGIPGDNGTHGDYLSAEEMNEYLPDAINKILNWVE